MKKFISLVLAGIIGSVITISIFEVFKPVQNNVIVEHSTTNTIPTGLVRNISSSPMTFDFTIAAEKAMPAVVHITSTQTNYANNQSRAYSHDPFFDFFNNDLQNYRRAPQPKIGTGSGVIISEDGYIVTNNHVIDKADDIEVTLHDKRTYKAKVIGTDPSTDLALIKIEETALRYLPSMNSDDIKVGEWVLAVGNPFNLTSTVTAGIISAKGRNINILKDRSAVESFIQTDAAVNPGNSGGALINIEGKLVGINTAIASPTGSYSGYSFAVPSNIVEKVVADLIKFGIVQRGYLGVMIRGLNGNLARELELEITEGVYIDSILENSSAKEAGIKAGDIIVKIDGVEVKTSPKLQEAVARHRPGDIVLVTVIRDNRTKEFSVTLKNIEGNTNVVTKEKKAVLNILGAEFQEINTKNANKLNIDGGIQIKSIGEGKLRKFTNMQKGFIITRVNGKKVTTTNELVNILSNHKGGVMIEGIYPGSSIVYYYALGL